MRRSLTIGTYLLVAACGLLLATAVATPAATASVIPAPLKFYQSPPPGWQFAPVGTLLKWQYEPTSWPALDGLKGYRVMYVSVGALGKKVYETAMVYFPTSGSVPKAGRPVVAWDHGTSGVDDSAAPSRYPWLYPEPLSDAWDVYAQFVGNEGRMGYIVACPDYEGLGTPGVHTYLNAGALGRSTIDAVRAARALACTLGIRASTSWAATGHSEGGQAALAAAELASTYGKGLSLRATVAVAPAVELRTIIPLSATSFMGYPYVGYVAWGIKAVDPSFDFSTVCGPWILPVIDQAQNDYFDEWWNLLLGSHLDPVTGLPLDPGPGDALAAGWNSSATVQRFLASTDVESMRPSGPVLVVQGTDDDFYTTFDTFVGKLTNLHTNLQTVVLPGESHDTAVLAGWPYAQAFLSDKLPIN